MSWANILTVFPSTQLFSFGPGLFFLFAKRTKGKNSRIWKKVIRDSATQEISYRMEIQVFSSRSTKLLAADASPNTQRVSQVNEMAWRPEMG